MRHRCVACCPCFETLAMLAPQHEVVLFQQAKPHPEEAANGSRECAPDDRLRAVSKDGLQYRFVIPGTKAGPARFRLHLPSQLRKPGASWPVRATSSV